MITPEAALFALGAVVMAFVIYQIGYLQGGIDMVSKYMNKGEGDGGE